MTHQTLNQVIPAQQSTCQTCPKFQDYQDRGRGLCKIFDKVVRKQHLFTSDCRTAIEAEELKRRRDKQKENNKNNPLLSDSENFGHL